MEIHIDAIKRDLVGVINALGDESLAEQWRRLADAVEPSLRLRVIDLLTEAALSLNGQLSAGHVEVRLAGRDPELVFVDDPVSPEEPPAPGDDLSARITLRLPEGLSSARLNELLTAEYDTQVVPGRFFGLDDHIRISLTLNKSDLTVALSRVSDAVGRLVAAGRD